MNIKSIQEYCVDNKYKLIVAIVIIGGLLWWLFSKAQKEEAEFFEVRARTVVEEVSATAVVEPMRDVVLTFERGGSIGAIYAKNGSVVRSGSAVASLQAPELYARLRESKAIIQSKEISYKTTQTSISNAISSKSDIQKEQDALVENAHKNYLNASLAAYSTTATTFSTSFSGSSPTVSGVYSSKEEGEYRIRVYASAAQSGYSFDYSGLESGSDEVSTQRPVALGTRGLYIQFPENFQRGFNTEWVVSIPNKRGATHIGTKNTYEQTLATRSRILSDLDRSIATTQGSATELLTLQQSNASIEQARASYASILAELSKYTLRAPFTGKVSLQEIEKGQYVTPGTKIATLISDQKFQIKAYVADVDVARIKVGNPVAITVDALGSESFAGVVSYIDSVETMIDGVPSYKVLVVFNTPQKDIKSGMTADVDIETIKKQRVIAVPTRSIINKDGKKYVKIKKGEKTQEVKVVTGLRGSDGYIEIKKGLTLGDKVATVVSQNVDAE